MLPLPLPSPQPPLVPAAAAAAALLLLLLLLLVSGMRYWACCRCGCVFHDNWKRNDGVVVN